MPLITATAVWQSATLTQDEIWQPRTYNQPVLVTVEAPTGSDDLRGIQLQYGEVRVFRIGQTVSWRCPGVSSAIYPIYIHRELHQ